MENRNGYFKPIIESGEFYLKFFPPQEGGKNIDVKDVTRYLMDKGYPSDDKRIKEINKAISSSEPVVVYIDKDVGIPFNERVSISMSLDYMLVRCTFYAGADNYRAVSEEDIYDALKHKGVVCGIDESKIKELVQEHQYCTEYLIAKGIPPTLGKDARIEYFFSTNRSLKPKHNEDGSVNYHDLDIISKVEKDQLLARLIPAVPGNPGKTVRGEDIKPRDVQNLHLSYANNIRVSEDGMEIYSEVTGHASLVQGKVFVSGVYEVPADVDNSIGDIEYPGNVLVRGNVKSGFIVKADGDIVVEGVVEGAQLYAGGQIIVKRGIHGMGKGLLKAKSNVVIKFIESATVESGGYVDTESIIQSKVSASTEIIVNGGKGLIIGGDVQACNRVSARTIGSEMGTSTVVEVGVEPEKLERFSMLQQTAKELAKKIEAIRPILLNYSEKLKAGVVIPADKVEFMKQQVIALKSLQSQLAPVNEELNILRTEFMNAGRAKVEIQNVIYPGVVIKISELSITTKDQRKYCYYVKEGAEIKVKNL
ncbi:MAG: DUF342 domain-containing protein [Lachnospiraceae bacterium]|nr:DUF342 domain-containing protein [Lachnospiraceae bacterium]